MRRPAEFAFLPLKARPAIVTQGAHRGLGARASTNAETAGTVEPGVKNAGKMPALQND